MSTVSLNEKIPNNVDLAADKRLQRAIEQWQPRFLDWWREMGPDGFQACDIDLRTAISVDSAGWAIWGQASCRMERLGSSRLTATIRLHLAYRVSSFSRGRARSEPIEGSSRQRAATAPLSPTDFKPV
jgi:hypothetical protein